MNVVIVETRGVLFPPDKAPPAADPIVPGLNAVRFITEGMNKVRPLLVHDGHIDDGHIREWCHLYGMTSVMVLTRPKVMEPGKDFWRTEVLTWVAKMRANPAFAIVSSTEAANLFIEMSVPVLRLYPPLGTLPDWGPTKSSWSNSEDETIEEE